MTLLIERLEVHERIIFRLSGRIGANHLGELRELFDAESWPVAVDLNQVRLVDQAAVNFLACCEACGIALEGCPAYIREWIAREGE